MNTNRSILAGPVNPLKVKFRTDDLAAMFLGDSALLDCFDFADPDEARLALCRYFYHSDKTTTTDEWGRTIPASVCGDFLDKHHYPQLLRKLGFTEDFVPPIAHYVAAENFFNEQGYSIFRACGESTIIRSGIEMAIFSPLWFGPAREVREPEFSPIALDNYMTEYDTIEAIFRASFDALGGVVEKLRREDGLEFERRVAQFLAGFSTNAPRADQLPLGDVDFGYGNSFHNLGALCIAADFVAQNYHHSRNIEARKEEMVRALQDNAPDSAEFRNSLTQLWDLDHEEKVLAFPYLKGILLRAGCHYDPAEFGQVLHTAIMLAFAVATMERSHRFSIKGEPKLVDYEELCRSYPILAENPHPNIFKGEKENSHPEGWE
ncbi:MAG: hypothetical protein Q3962_00445 [Corynebacterium sp.]|nr:hypothetical protein [Corynebacterium sp.]